MSNKAAVQALQAKEKVMQDEIERFKKLQKDLQKFTASRMQLDTQVNENKTVKEVALSSEEISNTHTFTAGVG
jgi:chaperonin cofactor prefoldin